MALSRLSARTPPVHPDITHLRLSSSNWKEVSTQYYRSLHMCPHAVHEKQRMPWNLELCPVFRGVPVFPKHAHRLSSQELLSTWRPAIIMSTPCLLARSLTATRAKIRQYCTSTLSMRISCNLFLFTRTAKTDDGKLRSWITL